MKSSLARLAGVLLLAAPLWPQLPAASDPVVSKGRFEWFRLSETRAEVAKQLGLPAMVAGFGADFESWQYQLGPADDEEGFSHQLVFRKSTGELISVARNFAPERSVDELFPVSESNTYFYPNADEPRLSVCVRKLSGERLLLAIGVSKPGQPTGQIFLIRQTELRVFYPWLADQLHI